MTRPMKRRRVCGMPKENRFGPLGRGWDREKAIQLSVEEYEVIRLIDLNEQTQEESAEQMGVARTTVQRMYSEARKKVAQMLIEGKMILIEGGNYELCGEEQSNRSQCNHPGRKSLQGCSEERRGKKMGKSCDGNGREGKGRGKMRGEKEE